MAKQKGITQIAGLRSGGYAMNITSSIDKLKVNQKDCERRHKNGGQNERERWSLNDQVGEREN